MRENRLSLLLTLMLSVSLVSSVAAQTGRGKRGTLSSRRGTRVNPALNSATRVEQQLVMGRVGVVRVPSVTLRAGRTPRDRALAVVTQDTNLAILMEKDGYYGVLMQDNSMGWVLSGAVEMLDYRVEVKLNRLVSTVPTASPSNSVSADAPNPVADTVGNGPQANPVIREAFTYLGVPYVWAGNSRNGLDCSAFVRNVFAASRSLALPRHSGDQARFGSTVESTSDLQPGDRLYFDMGRKGRISHCGIYLGSGYFIHASSNRHCVGVDKLATDNYWNALVAARHDP